ncbi:MAG: hypothetical protein ACC653_10745 [Gammaproteobacteria bacterium]
MSELIVGVFMGVIGMGYFVYGKRQKHTPAFLSAIGLFLAPYLTSNIYTLIGVSIVLILMPFYFDF